MSTKLVFFVSILLAITLSGCAMHRLENAVEEMSENDTLEDVCIREGLSEDFGGLDRCVEKARRYNVKWHQIKDKQHKFSIADWADAYLESSRRNPTKSFGEYFNESQSKRTTCRTRRDYMGGLITECE